MSTTLPLFWHLSSVSKKERIDASVKLVGALEQFQATFVPKEPLTSVSESEEEEQEEDGAAQKTDMLDALNAQDVSYSIRRLVRGLASPRESSRLGFAVALTELLSRINTVTCAQIVKLILDGTKSQGSMSGQEERDMHFARLFGFAAIIQSGLLVRGGSLPMSGSSTPEVSTLSAFEEVVKGLYSLGEKKAWLRESVWWTIGLAVGALNESQVPWKSSAVDSLLEQLFAENKVWSPEKVALAIKMQEVYPALEWSRYLTPAFKKGVILHSSNLQPLAKILKVWGSQDEEGEEIAKATPGTWKPGPHYVWDVILDHYLPTTTPSVEDIGFQEFYRIVVDESLFSSTSSAERKYWGFRIFQKALPRVSDTTMPMLFTKNFMRCWINHLSNRDRYLHKIARQTAVEVKEFVRKNPQLGLALILQLTGMHGHQQFDKLTKTTTVESILTAMDLNGIKDYVNYLLAQSNKQQDGEKLDAASLDTKRSWIIDQFGSLVRNTSVPKSDNWVIPILNWLTVNGLCTVKKKTKSSSNVLHIFAQPPLKEELRQQCCTRLLIILGDLNSQTSIVKTDNISVKATAVASDGEFWMAKVLRTIKQLEEDTKHIAFCAKISPQVEELYSGARETLSRLREATDETSRGAELLLLATLLQSYCSSAGSKVGDEELEACINAINQFFPIKKKKGPKIAETDDTETSFEPIDTLVDTIIGFMEKSTAYLRVVGNQAFASLSSAIKESTIDLILAQLERRDPSELLENDEEGSDQDVEMEDGDNESESSVESDKVDEENDSGEDEGEEGDEVNPEFRSKVEEVLRSSGAHADSDEEEGEELMDDDQMMAIDEQLANVFRSQMGDKKMKKNTGAQREATHFKNRVLDLVDTFLKKQPTSPLALRLINPLVELMISAGPDEQQLADKTKSILRSRFGKTKELPLDADLDSVKLVFTNIHVRARKIHSAEHLKLLSQCSLYLSRILLHQKADVVVLDAYRQSLSDFLTRKNSNLNPGFFEELLRRFPSPGWQLHTYLVDLVTKAVNTYRQCQAFYLLDIIIKQPSSLSQYAAELTKPMPQLRKTLLELIQSACDEETTLSAAQLKAVLGLVLSAIRLTQQSGALLSETWDPPSWEAMQTTIRTSKRYKTSPVVIKLCGRIIGALQVGPGDETKQKQKQKRKAEDASKKSEPSRRKRTKLDENA
ncbi:hypothetical protein AMATHDRAFT_139897 [Amanita thiersii Skay4041]|uniref:DNA polymerase V n=1 Tax=Amanita thiersii Skay4041 TaxID=703135 RepID=A0A2A9NPF4_9AGAR|nr:hypothetical protein AMATHDRAFT_139897 [Amanita thiersii Skay4041]